MAKYLELADVSNDSDLQDKIAVAITIAADKIRTDTAPPTNQANRLVWAANAMANPVSESKRMIRALLAQNNTVAIAAIRTVSDSTIQTAVDAAVDLFAG